MVFSASGLSTAPVSNVLDEGKYVVRIASAESVLSAQKKTPGIKMDLVVISGPVQNSEARIENRHIFSTMYIANEGQGHDIGLMKLAKLCKAAGIDQTDDLELNDLVGKEVVATIKHRMYNGEAQEDVTAFQKYTE